jgi:uncharacterized membrane protein
MTPLEVCRAASDADFGPATGLTIVFAVYVFFSLVLGFMNVQRKARKK